ncbi:hypothetical protein [Thalassospira povalilytica]|uniref:Uncharacterized protein n=1 Tax=Thalassospira povalilytica TaxID=732237 RepID=A0A8I1SIE5_9PROT|nr:hypothetical protein [Thalassospira povalilytica]MBN8195326.1 hypothetical protein [Thalassospira povalilytica]
MVTLKELEGYRFAYLYQSDDTVSADVIALYEGKRKLQDLGKGWVLAWDNSGAYEGDEPHVHVYRHGRELYSVTISGKGHDGSSGERIHRIPLKGIQARWPHIEPIIEDGRQIDDFNSYVPHEVKEALDSLVLSL